MGREEKEKAEEERGEDTDMFTVHEMRSLLSCPPQQLLLLVFAPPVTTVGNK